MTPTVVDVVEFERVSGVADLDEVRALRTAMYASRYSLDPSAWAADRERDVAGHVFLARVNGCASATLRFLPLTTGQSELARLGILPPDVSLTDPTVAEGGRLAARARAGGGPRNGLLMQVWASAWSLSHTPLRRWVAWSRSDLLPIHDRVGARILSGPLSVPLLGPGEFFVVGGYLRDVVEAGLRLGCESVVLGATS